SDLDTALSGYRLIFGEASIEGIQPNTDSQITVKYETRLTQAVCAFVTNTKTSNPKTRNISINPSLVSATIYYNYTGTIEGAMHIFWMVIGK
ncbi:hypothetical protein D3Z51_20445, partial [Clostridiaceae bacterium]